MKDKTLKRIKEIAEEYNCEWKSLVPAFPKKELNHSEYIRLARMAARQIGEKESKEDQEKEEVITEIIEARKKIQSDIRSYFKDIYNYDDLIKEVSQTIEKLENKINE